MRPWREDDPPGAALERATRRCLTAAGLATSRRVRRTGASGGTHEVDVLAVGGPGRLRMVVVECKDRRRPATKDDVAKLAWVAADLGATAAVLVSPAGHTSEASIAAAAAGVDLAVSAREVLGLAGPGPSALVRAGATGAAVAATGGLLLGLPVEIAAAGAAGAMAVPAARYLAAATRRAVLAGTRLVRRST